VGKAAARDLIVTAHRIDQGMAAAAARALPAEVTAELRTRYRQLRVMLRTAGLAATYAFIAAKAGDTDQLAVAYRSAGEAIVNRLSARNMFPDGAQPASVREVLTLLGRMDRTEYARASAEAAALAGWLARLADALFVPGDANAPVPGAG
jgi:CRISPR/Cas system CMR-associated protein Cmr5 small subunit